MHDWEHLLARWVVGVLVFAVASAVTAPLSALLWRWRRYLSPVHLKGALTAVVLKPAVVAFFTAFLYSTPSCAYHSACYFGWLQQNLGTGGISLMRAMLLAIVVLFVLFAVKLVVHAVAVLGTLRQLRIASHPPSDTLQQVLQQVVPAEAYHRFREAPIPAHANGVYAGTCFLSEQSVQTLDAMQLRAVVAHEWQHLRARDGWFALWAGLLVRCAGSRAWSAALRRWSQAAELLADARTAQLGVPRVELAKTLLLQQASAQGVSLGFGANGTMLEERLQQLISPPVPVSRMAFSTWGLVAGICGLVLYAVWLASGATTCTIHCVLF